MCVCENQGTDKTGEKEIYENGKRTVSIKFINIEDVNQTLAVSGSQQTFRVGEEDEERKIIHRRHSRDLLRDLGLGPQDVLPIRCHASTS